MNSPLWRKLLDVDTIPSDAEHVVLAWEHSWPAWVWVLAVVACLGLAWWTYFHIDGRSWVRAALAVVRAAVLLFAIVLMSGPMLEMPQEHTEQDWVLILADRSSSMSIADVGASSARSTREGQLEEVIRNNADLWKSLGENRQVVWMGFNQRAFDLPFDPATGSVTLGEPSGWRTNLSAAMEQALQRAAARPLSGIVVLSDGRTGDPPTRALLRQLAQDTVHVSVVPLGSSNSSGDLAIRSVESPRRAFVRDRVPISVEIGRAGDASSRNGTVRLVDTSTGRELDAVELSKVGDDNRVMLSGEPQAPGEATWRVVIDGGGEDLIPDNNAQAFTIELIDRPLHVLYVEGYARWEYRYVKNLLVREDSIQSSVMLLSADRDFAQEGNAPITRLPRTAEEFADYDVIILGDVPSTFFSSEQLNLIRDQVALKGAGLLWIAGPRAMPSTYGGSELVDLLPLRGNLLLDQLPQQVNMVPTPLADRLGVLQMVTAEGKGWPVELTDPNLGWSSLRWAQAIEPGGLKPTAEVLAQTVQTFGAAPAPLIVHMRFGAGRVLYVATDEIWRWRYGRGELLPEQFWIQMVRMLGRESISGGSQGAVLTVEPQRIEVGRPALVRLRIEDAQLAAPGLSHLGGTVSTASGSADLELVRAEDVGAAEFVTTFTPDSAGDYTFSIDDPALGGLRPDATLIVENPDDEMRHPETDHPLLESLAQETGGRVLDPDNLKELLDPRVLPNRAVTTITSIRESIWNTPLALGLLVGLLTLEWIGRRLIRLT